MGDFDGHDVEVGYRGHATNSHVVKYMENGESPQSSGSKGRKMSIVVIFLAVLCFGLGAYILVTGPLSSLLISDSSGFTGICDSAECTGISFRSIESGDFELNPCDNFYSFACSKWQLHNPTSQEQLYSAANINQIKDGVDFYIKRLLQTPEAMGVNGSTGLHVYSSPKAFYESCLHYSSPNESEIITELVKSLGGYKTLNSWSNSDFDLTATVLKFLQVNAAPLFDLTLDIDPRDKTKYALIIELPRPTSLVPNLLQPLSRQDDVIMSDKLNYDLTEASNSINFNLSDVDGEDDTLYKSTVDRHSLYKMITDNLEIKRLEKLQGITEEIGKIFGLKQDEIQKDVKSIKVFAENIEKIKPSHRSRKFWKQQNKVYNAFNLESLQRLFNNINWKTLLEGLFFGSTAKKIEIGNFSLQNATIYVPYPDYLRRLSQAIQFTEKRVLMNGMLVMYVKDMLNDINPKKKESEPRWKFCVHSTLSVFAMEMSSLYMRSFDQKQLDEMKRDVEEIFSNVKETLLEHLNQSHWQNVGSRQDSIKKVHSLKGRFIGPDFYLNHDYLEDRIKKEIKVQIDPKNFLANVQLVYKIFRKQLYAQYLKKIDEERATWSFVTFPTTVNAFYIQQFNSLVVPLAFLNPPHYIFGAPQYINYATIALTIAHEALHALDSSGSGFDSDGKLNYGAYNDQQRGFLKEKSACVAKQYFDKFRQIIPFQQSQVNADVINMYYQVDGNLTQNENLADIGGLQVALEAYSKYLKKSGSALERKKLPGLKFRRDQMYFLAVAQAYCANISPMGYIFLLEMDEHTPHPERINGMLMNIPEFATAFQCPAKSWMNPDSKCSLW